MAATVHCEKCGRDGPAKLLELHLLRCTKQPPAVSPRVAPPDPGGPYLAARVPTLRLGFSYAAPGPRAALCQLATRCGSFVGVRGDGNCFYRAALYCALAGGARAALLDCLAVAPGGALAPEQWPRTAEELVCDVDVSNALVCALRWLVAKRLREDRELAQLTLASLGAAEGDLERVLAEQVLPMGVEAVQPFVVALCRTLPLPLCVEWMRSDGVHASRYPDDDASIPAAGTLLYRPGHYDVLLPCVRYDGSPLPVTRHDDGAAAPRAHTLWLPPAPTTAQVESAAHALLGHRMVACTACEDGSVALFPQQPARGPSRYCGDVLHLLFDVRMGSHLVAAAGTAVRLAGCACSQCPFPGAWCAAGAALLDTLEAGAPHQWPVVLVDSGLLLWDVPLYWLV